MNLHEVRETHMVATLLELGFMDSRIDVPILLTDEFAEKCANAIVEVIVKKANLTKPMSDAEYVQNKCGFSNATMDYLKKYKYSTDLLKKLRKAMR